MKSKCVKNSFMMLSIMCLTLSVFSADVPAILPKPDANPPTDGKVKVYVLAGQSNMVGFGRFSGSQPVYPTIFLSADPAIVPCRMPAGPSALLPHGVYQSAEKDAPKGAMATVYNVAYSADTDYSKMKPVKQEPVALGTVSAQLPSIDGPCTVVVNAFIDVPESGAFEIHVGYQDSVYAVATLDGKDVYRRDSGKDVALTKVNLERGKRYPISITYQKGGSAALWLEMIGLEGKGDLTTVVNKEGKFPWFSDGQGNWSARKDVMYWDVRTSKDPDGGGGLLTVTSNGKHIGPEVPFGYVVGTYHEEPVLLIESSMGNRALNFDFRPPSSGKTEEEKTNKYCGYEYNHMVEGVRKTLKNIDKVMPGYKGQGYEVVGFVWFQGHKDSGQTKEQYEGHLVNLINDLRKDLEAPEMKVVVATVGFHGKNLPEGWHGVHAAQMAVGDVKQHPEFAGKVATVDTRPYWRERADSPTGTDYHYNHNAEFYSLTGDALGREMVRMLGGKAEALKLPPQKDRHADVTKIFSNEIVNVPSLRSQAKYGSTTDNPSAEGYAKMAPALRPILLEKMIPEFIETAVSPDNRPRNVSLKALMSGKKPSRIGESLGSEMDTLISYYEAAGITDYSWKTFGTDMKDATWNYYSFDPPEKQPAEKSDRYRKITFPQGMENWFAADFDAAKAEWKQGKAPFGQKDGKQVGRKKSCFQPSCACHVKPATLWEKEVLLMQQTFDLPAAKAGHVYRVLLGGAGCDRSGEGFAIYVNGKLLEQRKGGFFRSEGVRGAYIFGDILPEFKGGKVTISIINFLRYTHHRNQVEYLGKPVLPNGHVFLSMEEAKLPPEAIKAAVEKK